MTAAPIHLDDRRDHDRRLDPRTVTAPPPESRATVRTAPLPTTARYPPLFAVMGAHGGAGTSTLARWWAPAADTGDQWPGSDRTTQRVLLAARLCLPGLTAAADRLREWHAGLVPEGITVIGLVLTPVSGRRAPVTVRRYRATVAELVTPIYDIAWHDELACLEISDLAQFFPGERSPARRGRSSLTRSVPAEVHRTAEDLLARIAAERGVDSQSSEDTQ
ncbi:hypothetical protein [Nocardia carnea]|uniref:hypothetical protein n=1 Tax=Nocardia carnea TaxID=37328 RepID=UPI002456D3DB|nr:hypothetical protein [Nocardia carnea]